MLLATKMLAVFLVPTLAFAYLMDLPSNSIPGLAIFCIISLLLALCFDFRKAEAFRIAVLVFFLVAASFYTVTQSTSYSLSGVDSYIFFSGAQAVKQNQSPYSSPIASNLNLGFVPIYALCAVMGDSLHEFQRNLLLMDWASLLMILVIVAGGLFYFFRKDQLHFANKVEIFLEVSSVSALLYLFFRWDRSLGNFCTLLALLVILIMVSHYFEKPLATGLLLGIAISLKPYFVTLAIGYGIYLFFKRDKESLVVILSAAFLLSATALVLELAVGGLGFNTYIEFFTDVSRKHIPSMLDNVDNISAWAALSASLRNFRFPFVRYLLSGFTLLVSLLAYCGGLFLCIKDSRKRMPMENVVYYFLLTIAIYPLLWERYFAWILGPAIYVVGRLNLEQGRKRWLPSFLFCCSVLLFSPIAWIGSFGLPAIILASTIQESEAAPARVPAHQADFS